MSSAGGGGAGWRVLGTLPARGKETDTTTDTALSCHGAHRCGRFWPACVAWACAWAWAWAGCLYQRLQE
jgi:hypothetical protein